MFVIGGTREDAEALRAHVESLGTLDVVGTAIGSGNEAWRTAESQSRFDAVLLTPNAFSARAPRRARRAGDAEPMVEMLTGRERTVLALAAGGLGNREIAQELAISEHTVKFHLASIFGKLGASSRTDAVRRGIRLGLVDL